MRQFGELMIGGQLVGGTTGTAITRLNLISDGFNTKVRQKIYAFRVALNRLHGAEIIRAAGLLPQQYPNTTLHREEVFQQEILIHLIGNRKRRKKFIHLHFGDFFGRLRLYPLKNEGSFAGRTSTRPFAKPVLCNPVIVAKSQLENVGNIGTRHD
jgi:hypothetical protein